MMLVQRKLRASETVPCVCCSRPPLVGLPAARAVLN